MLSFFLRDVLDEIWDLIGSVSEGFSTYFSLAITNISKQKKLVEVYEPIVHKYIDVFFEKLYTYTA